MDLIAGTDNEDHGGERIACRALPPDLARPRRSLCDLESERMHAEFTIDGHRVTRLYFRAGDEAVCVSAQGHVCLEPVSVLDGRRTALLSKLAGDVQIASALAEAESIASANGLALQRDQVYLA